MLSTIFKRVYSPRLAPSSLLLYSASRTLRFALLPLRFAREKNSRGLAFAYPRLRVYSFAIRLLLRFVFSVAFRFAKTIVFNSLSICENTVYIHRERSNRSGQNGCADRHPHRNGVDRPPILSLKLWIACNGWGCLNYSVNPNYRKRYWHAHAWMS